jgi:hypothetical protein
MCCVGCAGAAVGVCSKTICSLIKFFERHGDNLTTPLVQGLLELMDLSDNDLLDLLLARKEPEGDLTNAGSRTGSVMMRVNAGVVPIGLPPTRRRDSSKNR